MLWRIKYSLLEMNENIATIREKIQRCWSLLIRRRLHGSRQIGKKSPADGLREKGYRTRAKTKKNVFGSPLGQGDKGTWGIRMDYPVDSITAEAAYCSLGIDSSQPPLNAFLLQKFSPSYERLTRCPFSSNHNLFFTLLDPRTRAAIHSKRDDWWRWRIFKCTSFSVAHTVWFLVSH